MLRLRKKTPFPRSRLLVRGSIKTLAARRAVEEDSILRRVGTGWGSLSPRVGGGRNRAEAFSGRGPQTGRPSPRPSSRAAATATGGPLSSAARTRRRPNKEPVRTGPGVRQCTGALGRYTAGLMTLVAWWRRQRDRAKCGNTPLLKTIDDIGSSRPSTLWLPAAAGADPAARDCCGHAARCVWSVNPSYSMRVQAGFGVDRALC